MEPSSISSPPAQSVVPATPAPLSLEQQHIDPQVLEAAQTLLELKYKGAGKPFKCLICKVGFDVQSSLYRHNRLHIGDLRCIFCGKIFDRRYRLKDHLVIHTGIYEHICDDPGCGAHFADRSSFKEHLKTHAKH